MALVSALAVGIGGAFGAVSRYAVGEVIERRAVDTFVVNTLGSFVLGFVVGIEIGGPPALALAVGFCGAFTTFSSFAVETVRLAEEKAWVSAAVNAGGTLLVALCAALAGGAVGAYI
ncbi:MAG: CrcB family protein [Natronomonas sp.]